MWVLTDCYPGIWGNMLAVLGVQQAALTNMSSEPLQETAEEQALVDFVSVVLADTEETWSTIFQTKGQTY